MAAPAAQGRPRRVPARSAMVRNDDGSSRSPARIRGEIELIWAAVHGGELHFGRERRIGDNPRPTVLLAKRTCRLSAGAGGGTFVLLRDCKTTAFIPCRR